MPIAPITGKFRRRLITDLSVAFGLGLAGGYLYWYGVHLPWGIVTIWFIDLQSELTRSLVRKREAFYLKLEQEEKAKQG